MNKRKKIKNITNKECKEKIHKIIFKCNKPENSNTKKKKNNKRM